MNKNRFDGLRFRILETLEKQPGGAPLTSDEITSVLHSGEYRDQMRENLLFKVTRAVHSMKELGQIVVADARDKQGRLTYQLPQRLRFPPKVADAPPANPVLNAEQAAQIRPLVEAAAAAAPKKESRKILHVENIGEHILDELNKSPHPLLTSDLAERLGPLYGDVYRHKTKAELNTVFAGHMHHMFKQKRSGLQRRRQTGGGRFRYEYFTRKTGKEPHPLAVISPSSLTASSAQTANKPEPVKSIGARIFDTIDQAPHPLTLNEICDAVKDYYGDRYAGEPEKLQSAVSGNLTYLVNKTKRVEAIPARKQKGRPTTARYVYLTPNTGRETAVLEPPVLAAAAASPAPTPSTEKPALFRPQKPEDPLMVSMQVQVPPEKYDRIKALADKFEITIKDFINQALDYALENTEGAA